MIKFISTTIIICLFSFVCDAQEYRDSAVWHNIEHSIISKSFLTVSRNKIEQLKPQIWKAKDYPALARFYYYQMLIDDLRTEDTLYFKNSAFIDKLLGDKNIPVALKTFLHVMQAKRLSVFNNRDLRFDRERYKIAGLNYNYAAFKKGELDSIVEYHFGEAKKAVAINNYSSEEILWLSSDPLSFIFTPVLTDIIITEQIRCREIDRRFTFDESDVKHWMKLSPDSFMVAVDSLWDIERYSSLPLYSEWWKYHRNEKQIYYCIEQLARMSVNSRLNRYSNSYKEIQQLYEAYQERQITSPYDEVKLLAIPEVCESWFAKGDLYASEDYYYGRNGSRWDTTYQYYPAKALQLYEANVMLFEKYPRLNDKLRYVRKRILSKTLRWQMEDENLPATPMLVKLTYKNVPHVYYRLVKINSNETIPNKNKEALDFLLNKEIIKEEDETLPLPPDHNRHNALLKVDPLAAGEYVLLFADHPVHTGDTMINFQRFIVTSIALLHDGKRVYVLDRKTGMPLKDAIVNANYQKDRSTPYYKKQYKVNQQGYFDVFEEGSYDFNTSYRGDTLSNYFSISNDELPEDVFDKDEYTDLLEFYSDKAEVEIFTDRSIYRPGQKVYYKAIFVTKDPQTGMPLIMNKRSMHENYFKKWLEEDEPWMTIEDPFGKIIDSVEVKPDEYGAVTGVFTIPKTAATGEWRINSNQLEIGDANSGIFQVEEYKRPTYELTVDKPVKAYTLQDTIAFIIHARSFAGVRLSNMQINYTITRNGEEFMDSTGYTDDKGQLNIKVYDTLKQRAMINDSGDKEVVLWYGMKASTTDATGESHSVEDGLKISTRPVDIKINIKRSYHVKDWLPLLITAEDANGIVLSKDLSVSIYKLSTTGNATDFTFFSDQYIYQKKDLQKWFPQISNLSEEVKENEQLVYTTTVHTADYEKLRLPEGLLTSATYRILITCKENGRITGLRKRDFTIFDTESSTLPDSAMSFYSLPYNLVNAGETLLFYSGSGYDNTYVLQQVKYYSSKGGKIHPVSFVVEQNKKAGITEWKWKIPKDAVNGILLNQVFVINNTVYQNEQRITINSLEDHPRIIIEKFRRELAPGASTSFSVSVKTKNINVAAELMSVMYDASLDRIEKHKWNVPNWHVPQHLSNDWPGSFSRYISKDYFFPDTLKVQEQTVSDPLLALQGRAPGLALTEVSALNDIVVMGYGVTTTRYNTGNITTVKASNSKITIQGISNLIGNTKPLIIIDGVPFTGSLSSINVSELTNGVILRDADATAIYGSRGADGVLLLSTKGPIVLPEVKAEVPVKVRSNFNETAFFFPAVYADKEGYYHFPFTVPESTTEWNWKLFAHTKDAQFVTAVRKLTTQLPLMVQPNMPRLLYQGDKMVLQTRISNLDSLDMKGTISCKVEDEVTGEDLTATIVSKAENTFSVDKSANTSAPFILTVPSSLLHPVRITIIAQTGNYVDAEEHVIPVLSRKSLVKESLSFQLSKTDTTINIPSAAGELYGVSLSMNPVPYAAIINALPFLSGYSFNCAEQTFNKLLAHAMAVKIVKNNKDMQQVFSLIRDKVEKDTVMELPASPWLDITNRTKKQQKELFVLLDKNESNRKIEMYLQRLYTLQNKDGGLAWFDGGNSNEYISEYILAGFGKLLKDSIHTFSSHYQYNGFIKKLISYCDTSFNKNETENYVIARSYWTSQYPLSTNFQHKINGYLTNEWRTISKRSLLGKARLITATLRSDSGDLRKRALEELESLRQLAISDEQGLRWKDIADADDLETNSEETIALLAEAFEGKQFKEVRTGILQWLLNTQSEHHWQTTKATAAAIRLLDTEKESIQGTTQVVDAMVGNNKITVSNDLLSGNLFSFVNMSATPASVSLKKGKDGIAKGDLTTYYFRDWDQITATGNNVQLTREFLYDGELKIGDKVKVVLHITSDKPLRYVHLEDKRAAAFEPSDGSSGNKYADGFSYYRSVRDDGSQFFIDFIPSGEHTISYELTVANEGEFSCGPASLECMYRPDIHAYSSFRQIKTIK